MIEITVEELLAIHKATIDEHGGLPGLKSEGMMLSALAQPMMGMGDIDFYPTLPEKIAALGFSLATNHAFHDGNKRVAFISMSVFALKNAYLLEVPEEEAIEFMLALADGGNKSVGRDELVQWLADHLVPSVALIEELSPAEIIAKDRRAIQALNKFNGHLNSLDGITHIYANEFISFAGKLTDGSQKIQAITAGPKNLVRIMYPRVIKQTIIDVNNFTRNIKGQLPQLQDLVLAVDSLIPKIIENISIKNIEEEKAIFDALINLGILVDKMNTVLDEMEVFQESVDELGKADKTLKPCISNMKQVMSDLRNIYTQNWFSYDELKRDWKGKI